MRTVTVITITEDGIPKIELGKGKEARDTMPPTHTVPAAFL